MLASIIFTIWLFLPAGVANMAPIFARRWRWMDRFAKPIDAGRSFRGHRFLGDNKTWRGALAGLLLAVATSVIQKIVLDASPALAGYFPVDISGLNPVLWGAAMAVGALGGDAIASFFKRQVGIPPGHNWVPFDQLDFVAGALLISLPIINLPGRIYLTAVILGLILHPLINLLGWVLRLKDKPF